MNIKIVFNNEAMDETFATGWGFSCFVDDQILFDTGEKTEYLSENMRKMAIDVSQIRDIVLSHDHWDHTGGLAAVIKKRHGIKVYGCPGFSQVLKNKVGKLQGEFIESAKFLELKTNIFITGEIPSVYKGQSMPEQALVTRTKNGISIITGCAHPGIINIIEIVKKYFKVKTIYTVLGGFHLHATNENEINTIARKFKELKVVKAGPAHCSGATAERIFQEHYITDFVQVVTGKAIEV